MIKPYEQTIDAVLQSFASSPGGLSEGEAKTRLKSHGRNELAVAEPVPAWRNFLRQFQNTMVCMLLAATAVSAAVWLYEGTSALPYEAIAIFAVVLLNAVMGFVQESRAESALAALNKMRAATARVVREGNLQTIQAAELVPGDIIEIEEGDTIPADARLSESVSLQTAEAALTGESLPVTKTVAPLPAATVLADRHNMVFSGTNATYGHGRAIVVGIGMGTEMGGIAGMLGDATPGQTPLQKELSHTGRVLGVGALVLSLVMVAAIFLTEEVHGLTATFEVLILGVALAVAAVPEGLPTVVTAVLSLGVQRMARRNVIVRHLAAVETLGSATVIASDKTGTLTRNEMTVRAIVTAGGRQDFSGTGYGPEGTITPQDSTSPADSLLLERGELLTAVDRATNATLKLKDELWTVQGDPTEGALLVAARKGGLASDNLNTRFTRLAEVPFSSERRLMSTIHADALHLDQLAVYTKGAPGTALDSCATELVGKDQVLLTAERRTQILKVNDQLAGEAMRTLGVAFRFIPKDTPTSTLDNRVEHSMVFLGLVGMIDPPRPEARSAVARAKEAGIRPLMITGDHPGTASVIALELGIAEDSRVLTGDALELLSDEALQTAVRGTAVYARVDPRHKLRIVRALQSTGEIVAMTGDGINDAPALKAADIGIAMGQAGTDVSRQAADMVLTDDNFASIVAAIEEGRAIFSNIRKFLRYLLASNIGEVLTMVLGVLLAERLGLKAENGTARLPLLATQLLWINVATDGAPALALGIDPAGADLMSARPRPRSERVITPKMWRGIVSVGVVSAAGTLLVLDASLPAGFIEGSGSLLHAQTMAFTTLVFFSIFTAFTSRSDARSTFSGLFTNRWLWGASALSVALQALVVYTPFLQKAFSTTALTLPDWVRCIAVASSVLWLREITSAVSRQITKNRAACALRHNLEAVAAPQ